jgi:glycosyltransferase involved in cell wall biosynthesis
LFAPGAPISALSKQTEISLLTFGMAHKISATGYRRLAKILAASNKSFQLEVSSALHEGTSFDANFFVVADEISQAFGGNVVFLGFLADQEVSRRLQQTTALVAFFPHGVRENNTTVMSAMAHGCAVISNFDELSPSWMKHGQTIFDINKLDTFPEVAQIESVRKNAQSAVAEFGFDRLASLIRKD